MFQFFFIITLIFFFFTFIHKSFITNVVKILFFYSIVLTLFFLLFFCFFVFFFCKVHLDKQLRNKVTTQHVAPLLSLYHEKVSNGWSIEWNELKHVLLSLHDVAVHIDTHLRNSSTQVSALWHQQQQHAAADAAADIAPTSSSPETPAAPPWRLRACETSLLRLIDSVLLHQNLTLTREMQRLNHCALTMEIRLQTERQRVKLTKHHVKQLQQEAKNKKNKEEKEDEEEEEEKKNVTALATAAATVSTAATATPVQSLYHDEWFPTGDPFLDKIIQGWDSIHIWFLHFQLPRINVIDNCTFLI